MKTTPLPAGFRIEVDPGTRRLSDELWFGGSPARVLRLTAAGRKAWQDLETGPVSTAATGALARRLTDTGFAHPIPPEPADEPDVTVVIPVHDRTELLERCLEALERRHPVLVVDDGSRNPAAVAALVAKHGAKLVRREENGGPAAARNSALDHVGTELVAFLDSDCVPTPGWVGRLATHFADPLLAAIAPRVRALAPDTAAGRYTRVAGSLDLGDRPARVAPGTRTSYVPTAALVARAAAVREVGAFDPSLRVGEDVDLVWRLNAAGFRVRYAPGVAVDHHEPASWQGLLRRRARYGTSAAPLSKRHPGALAPLGLHPWPALTVCALLARRPLLAAAAFGGSVGSMVRLLRAHDVPTDGVVRAMADAVGQTWLGCGRYGTQFAAPLLAALLARRGWRAAAASLLLGPPLTAWLKRRPDLDPVRYTAAAIADDLAYGAGVWAGCLTHRTFEPVRPALVRRPLRFDPKGTR
ncbi:mycofactocin biosynthesis glycosyltransferase MftF [Amycolatopsis sp. OK19-0408]|uniref:Mycofactocin biosynthesis glycosyltransferase MftF n=1 Tax=Amycolatopsis iheyensis TaxID=2945988 RepID=A0A9X2N956_9PSEU|nr:mycofactocin biosynthesis glycosyltransferase MftF [Amycolatopsis iheyensis]MCR6482871.1 mycofactocin biosynthesis glycosyltransferase MftF [Amycolatopsis iheyensis]